MATYYVMKKNENKDDGLQKYTMPLINIIPAFIYSAVFRQHFFPTYEGKQKFMICAIFFVAYMVISFLPYVSLITNIASAIMFIGMAWALIDHIGNNIVRSILKIVSAVFIGLLEFALVINSTIKDKYQSYKAKR